MFLSLKSPAFDLHDRGVAGRQVPTGLDAFVYTERGVYRSGETVHVTTLLRDALGIAAAAPLTLVMARPDGVEYRRALVADQGLGGHSWTYRSSAPSRPAPGASPPIPIPSVRRSARRRFLVEDYVPDRIEFDLKSTPKSFRAARRAIERGRTFPLRRAGLQSRLGGAVTIAAAKERPGFAGYSFGLRRRRDDGRAPGTRRSADDRRDRQGELPRRARQDPGHHASARSDDHGAAWRNPAAARSSARSRCRSRPRRR